MDKFITLQQKIAPEFTGLALRRYSILRHVYFSQPIGRRTLALRLNEKERSIRKEVEFLREQGLLIQNAMGVSLSREGEGILEELGHYVRELGGFTYLEVQLASRFNLKTVVIVPGNADVDPMVKKETGRVAAKHLKEVIHEGDIIACGGGTTMAEVAEGLGHWGVKRNVTVVPARGSLGEDVETQADTIAAKMAKKMGGSYRLLAVPDDLRPETVTRIVSEPRIKEVLEIMRNTDILIHGIGTVEEMVRRRRLGRQEVAILKEREAVGEFFGDYFNPRGEVVYSTPSMGVRLEELKARETIAVAAGESKAPAIVAVLLNRSRDTLITDEGAAKAILGMKGEPPAETSL